MAAGGSREATCIFLLLSYKKSPHNCSHRGPWSQPFWSGGAMEKIFEVTEVRLFVLESFPPQLRISASGIVPTRGWSHPQLKPHAHIQPPPDGIYDFDFIAERPGTLVPQMISLIHSDHVMTGFPDTLKGVRIHASQNSKTTLLDTGKPDRHPNRYTFSDGEGVKRVVFFPERFGPLGEGESDAGAHLEYNGPEG